MIHLHLHRLADGGEVFWIAAACHEEARRILAETIGLHDDPEDIAIRTVTLEEAAQLFVREDFEGPRESLAEAFGRCKEPQYIAGTVGW